MVIPFLLRDNLFTLFFLYFSLSRQREVNKRELVARFDAEEIQLFVLCCGTRYAQTVLAPPSATHSVLAFLCCISRYRNYI